MTRKEAIKYLNGIKAENLNIDVMYINDRYCALKTAIKSLDAWDKVIEEIEESKESVVGRYDVNTPELERPYAKTMRNNGRKEALEIIKKHLGEVEE